MSSETRDPFRSRVINGARRKIGAEKPLGSRYLWQEAHSIKWKEAPMTNSITIHKTTLAVISWNTDHKLYICRKVKERKQLNQPRSWRNRVRRTDEKRACTKPTSESTQMFFIHRVWYHSSRYFLFLIERASYHRCLEPNGFCADPPFSCTIENATEWNSRTNVELSFFEEWPVSFPRSPDILLFTLLRATYPPKTFLDGCCRLAQECDFWESLCHRFLYSSWATMMLWRFYQERKSNRV